MEAYTALVHGQQEGKGHKRFPERNANGCYKREVRRECPQTAKDEKCKCETASDDETRQESVTTELRRGKVKAGELSEDNV